MRAFLYMIAAVVAIGLLRNFIGAIARLFSDFAAPSDARKPAVPISESLKQDPVCGAYVAPSSAIRTDSGGTTHYFCSPACRDKFAVRSQAS